MKFKKILVPTDLSEASKAAFAYAIEQLEEYKSKIKLIYIIPVEHFPEEELFLPAYPDSEKYIDYQKRVAKHALDNIVEEHFEGVDIEKEIVVPHKLPVAEEIVKAAREFDSDAIVISSAGRGFFHRMFVGSTVQKVLQLSKCPVVVVPYQKEE